MSTILVADDNSNIQKMVGLVLKDQGIEVVAVGNGEAAVRRIPDVHPDLVLADVFMPLKNGYEVCEFVKKDQRFSHIPVILLVGAFDPLDEHEAQRVGADGVLKKPFVPPEPLISMVRSALSRSSDSGRPRPIPMPKRAAGSPRATSIPNVEATPAPLAPAAPAGHAAGPIEPDDFGIPPRPESVSFNDSEKPVAFGSLLETSSAEPAQAEPEASAEEYVAPVQHPALQEARHWGATPAEEQIEEGEEPRASWRRDESKEEEKVAAADSKASVKDWRDFEEPAPTTHARADAAPATQEPEASAGDFFAPESAPETEVIPDDHGAGGKSPSLEAEQEETPEPSATEESADIPQVSQEQSKAYESVFTPEAYPGLFVEEKPQTTASMQEDSADSPSAFAEVPTKEEERGGARAKVIQKGRAPAASEPETFAPNLWEEQVRQAARSVAASWPTKHPDAEPFPVEAGPTQTPATAHEDFELPALQETQDLEEEDTPALEAYKRGDASPEPIARAAVPEPLSRVPKSAHAGAAAPPAGLDIEAVVAKVLERMDPSIFQSVTQQLLKPIIEAIVRSELEKKR